MSGTKRRKRKPKTEEQKEKNRVYDYKRRISLKLKGLCTKCGKRPAAPNRSKCKSCISQCSKTVKRHRIVLRATGICTKCKIRPVVPNKYTCAICLTKNKNYKTRIKREVLDKYGGVCSCCGESNIGFLTIDHKNNDGNIQRQEFKQGTGSKFYGWLKKNNYPDGYQVQCWNCNCGRAFNNGICPHEEERMASKTGTNLCLIQN